MITSVGRFLRKLRIDRGEILKTMAQTLEVSSAFLSAVENGKKKFPDAQLEKMEDYYNLTTNQMEELKTAVIESSDVVELNMSNVSFENRQLAVSFARKFDSLDEETSRKKLIFLISIRRINVCPTTQMYHFHKETKDTYFKQYVQNQKN